MGVHSFLWLNKKKTSEHQQTDRTNKEIKTIKKNDTVNGTQRVNAIGRRDVPFFFFFFHPPPHPIKKKTKRRKKKLTGFPKGHDPHPHPPKTKKYRYISFNYRFIITVIDGYRWLVLHWPRSKKRVKHKNSSTTSSSLWFHYRVSVNLHNLFSSGLTWLYLVYLVLPSLPSLT